MSKTSKKYFEEGFKTAIWNRLLDNLKKAKTGKELNILLDKFFTPDEKIIIEKRLGILYLFEKGLSYRQIGKEMDVTLKTISFTKRGFKKPAKRIIKEGLKSNKPKIFEKLKKKSSLFPAYTGKGRWRFLNSY